MKTFRFFIFLSIVTLTGINTYSQNSPKQETIDKTDPFHGIPQVRTVLISPEKIAEVLKRGKPLSAEEIMSLKIVDFSSFKSRLKNKENKPQDMLFMAKWIDKVFPEYFFYGDSHCWPCGFVFELCGEDDPSCVLLYEDICCFKFR